MAEYACGTDAQGYVVFVQVPASMTLGEVRDLMEWALDPPYGTIYKITMTEVKRLAKARQEGGARR